MFDDSRQNRLRLAALLREAAGPGDGFDPAAEDLRLRQDAHHQTLGADIALHQFQRPPTNAAYMHSMALARAEASRSPQIGREDLLGSVPHALDQGVPLLREADGRREGGRMVHVRAPWTLREDLDFRQRFQEVAPGVKYRCMLEAPGGDLLLGSNSAPDILCVSPAGNLRWRLSPENFAGILPEATFFSSFTCGPGALYACAASGSRVVSVGYDGRLLATHDLAVPGVTFVEFDAVRKTFICVNEMDSRIDMADANLAIHTTWATPKDGWRPVQIRPVADRFLTCWGRGGWQSKVQWFSPDGEPGEVAFVQAQAPVHACKSAALPGGEAVVFDHFGTITGLDAVGRPAWRLALTGKTCRIQYGGAWGSSFLFSDLGVLRKFSARRAA